MEGNLPRVVSQHICLEDLRVEAAIDRMHTQFLRLRISSEPFDCLFGCPLNLRVGSAEIPLK